MTSKVRTEAEETRLFTTEGNCAPKKTSGMKSNDYRDVDVEKLGLTGGTASEIEEELKEQSISKTLEEEDELWTVYSAKVSLPAVLSDPSRWRPEADFFTKSWGETFLPLTRLPSRHLPIIKKSEFAYYIRQLAKPYKNHQRTTRLVLSRERSVGHVQRETRFSEVTGSVATLCRDSRRQNMKEIPKVFLQPDFDLGNPAMFREALPLQHMQGNTQTWMSASPGKRKGGNLKSYGAEPMQTSRLLHEKLTHYLDRVEVQLAWQISLKSDDFFQTISSQDTLADDLIILRRDISSLRQKLLAAQNPLNQGPLHMLYLKKRQLRLIAVYHKLKLMETVHQTQPTIQLLLATSDFVGALDLISTTQEVLQQELVGVQSFRHLGSQLIEMENMIEKVMEAEFIQFATVGLAQLRPEKVEFDPDDEDKLTSTVIGLLRLGKVQFLDVFRDEAFTAIKACIKQTVRRLVGIEAERDDSSGSSVAEHMRRLSFDEWFGMLQTVFQSVLIILQRLKVVHRLIVSVLEVCKGSTGKDQQQDARNPPEPCIVNKEHDMWTEEEDSLGVQVNLDIPVQMVSVEELDPQVLSEEDPIRTTNIKSSGVFTAAEFSDVEAESRELLCSACELVHVRCAKLIMVKGKDGSLERLIAPDFVRLVRALEGFIGDCEAVCGRQSHSLRATILAQAKKYLEKFHEEKRTKLVLLLDGERWTQVDEVPAQIQGIVTALENGQERLPGPRSYAQEFVYAGDKLHLKGEDFVVPGAVLLLLRIVYEYCRTADDVPMLRTDVMTRLVEVFQIFNKHTWQLVLGAGALQTVGLKSITAKHLALSAQCMCAIAALIPSVRQHFERRLQVRERVLLAQFDTLTEDYKNHVAEVHSKLVAMIEEVALKQLSKWEGKSTAPSQSFRNIVKQIAKLHDVLKSVLSNRQLRNLFLSVQRVFHTILKQRLMKLGAVGVNGHPAAQALKTELNFFVDSLRDLDGLEGIGRYLSDVWTSS